MITYDEKQKTNTAKERLTAIVELSSLSDFIQFDVVMNEIPIAKIYGEILDSEYALMSEHERGKDVVMNWEFLDNFDTDHNMWIDFNGLDM